VSAVPEVIATEAATTTTCSRSELGRAWSAALVAATDTAATNARADVAAAGVTPAGGTPGNGTPGDGRALRVSDPGATWPQIGSSRTEGPPSRPSGST
jgi:hypothetical protein